MEPQPSELSQGLEIFIDILFVSIPFLLLLLAYITGKVTEKRHYASIHEREGLSLIHISEPTRPY